MKVGISKDYKICTNLWPLLFCLLFASGLWCSFSPAHVTYVKSENRSADHHHGIVEWGAFRTPSFQEMVIPELLD